MRLKKLCVLLSVVYQLYVDGDEILTTSTKACVLVPLRMCTLGCRVLLGVVGLVGRCWVPLGAVWDPLGILGCC